MSKIISKQQQDSIIATIKAMCAGDQCEDPKERAHMLFLGVYIALGQQTPIHWVLNIQAGRTDRLLKEQNNDTNKASA